MSAAARGGRQAVPAAARERDPRALLPVDWAAAWMVAAAIFAAPLLAGGFPVPTHFSFLPADGLWTYLQDLGTPITTGLAALAFAVLAWREARRPVAIGGVAGLSVATGLLAALAILSISRSLSLYRSLDTAAVLLAGIMLAGVASRLTRDRAAWCALLIAIVAAAAAVSAIGINEYLTNWKQGAVQHRSFATFANPNFLAGYLDMVLPVTAAAYAAARVSAGRWLFGAALALQSACVLLTGSRAGVGIAILALVVWLALSFATRADTGLRHRIGLSIVVFLAAAVVASTPTMRRITGFNAGHEVGRPTVAAAFANTAAAESHSTEFRRWTWIGALRAIAANPILGFGLGDFEVAYPRYAVTAFTAHAHNSYLQWTDETGIPSAVCLLCALAAATAFAAHVLIVGRAQAATEPPALSGPAPSGPRPAGLSALSGVLDAPRLLLCALLAGIAASMLDSLFESAWYIVATLFTLCLTLALLVALARDIAPLATQTPRPLGRLPVILGACAAALVLWRSVATAAAQCDINAGAGALAVDHNPQAAIDQYRAAEGADPLDPEIRLDLAELYQTIGDPTAASREVEAAVRHAPVGKTLYRLGKLRLSQGDLAAAIDAFHRALQVEPDNLQTLRALAETQLQAGHAADAADAYQQMATLELEPYGTVRAVPERVETDFAYAHAGLGDIAFGERHYSDAATDYARAAAVLRQYWPTRSMETNELMSQQKRQGLADLYDHVVSQEQLSFQRIGAAADAKQAAEELAKVRADREADAAKMPQP